MYDSIRFDISFTVFESKEQFLVILWYTATLNMFTRIWIWYCEHILYIRNLNFSKLSLNIMPSTYKSCYIFSPYSCQFKNLSNKKNSYEEFLYFILINLILHINYSYLSHLSTSSNIFFKTSITKQWWNSTFSISYLSALH